MVLFFWCNIWLIVKFTANVPLFFSYFYNIHSSTQTVIKVEKEIVKDAVKVEKEIIKDAVSTPFSIQYILSRVGTRKTHVSHTIFFDQTHQEEVEEEIVEVEKEIVTDVKKIFGGRGR